MRNLEEELHRQFVIPVIRSTDPAVVEGLVAALAAAGFAVQEVTLMSEAVIPLLSRLRERHGLLLGAGTVLDREMAMAALVNGADFLVSPGYSQEVSDAAKAASRTYIPGVMTPTEVTTAHNHGHRLMKLFPAATMGGLAYLKNLQAPFPETRWMLTGGIKAVEAVQYRKHGVCCVGVGQDLFPAELVQRGAWDEITNLGIDCLSRLGGA